MRAEPGLALPAAAGADFPAGSLVGVLLTQPHTAARPGAAAGCSQGEPKELRLAFIPAGPREHPSIPQVSAARVKAPSFLYLSGLRVEAAGARQLRVLALVVAAWRGAGRHGKEEGEL